MFLPFVTSDSRISIHLFLSDCVLINQSYVYEYLRVSAATTLQKRVMAFCEVFYFQPQGLAVNEFLR